MLYGIYHQRKKSFTPTADHVVYIISGAVWLHGTCGRSDHAGAQIDAIGLRRRGLSLVGLLFLHHIVQNSTFYDHGSQCVPLEMYFNIGMPPSFGAQPTPVVHCLHTLLSVGGWALIGGKAENGLAGARD